MLFFSTQKDKAQHDVTQLSFLFLQDVQYGDIDYMDEQRDFTYDLNTYNGLPDYVTQLKSGGKHYVIILVKNHELRTNKS